MRRALSLVAMLVALRASSAWALTGNVVANGAVGSSPLGTTGDPAFTADTDGASGNVCKNQPARTSPTLADIAKTVAFSPNNTGLPVNLPKIVQSGGNVTASGTTVTTSLTPTQGNNFIVLCGVNNTGTIAVSDNNSNTWTTAKSQTGTIAGALVSYAVNVNSGATTFTCTAGTTGVVTVYAYEVSGLIAQTDEQPDATDTNTGSSQTAAALNAGLAPQTPNALGFAAIVLTTNNAGTAANSWNLDTQQGATGGRLLPARKALMHLATQTGNVATFTSASYALAAATFCPVHLGIQGSVELTDGVTKAGVTPGGALKGDTTSIAGTATSVNSGNKDAGTQRVVLATDQPTMTNAQPANIAQVNGTAPTEKAASTPAAATDTSFVVQPVPIAAPICTSFIAVSQTATTKNIAGVSGKKIYICAITLVANAAEVVSVTEGTGTTCATGQTAIYGSTTAANGMSFAANGGMAQASSTPFVVTSTNTDDLCVVQSGSSRVTGSISYVIQ